MVPYNKRSILDFKNEILMMAHEFEFECEYLKKYLEDSASMLEKANHLDNDEFIYSVEAVNYFWSVQHNYYFSCSFITMLMQISETMITQYFESASEIMGDDYRFIKKRIPYYESVDQSLKKLFGLEIKSKWWTELAIVYQARNIIVHHNGIINCEKEILFTGFINKYDGFSIYKERLRIDTIFCKHALKIFKKGLSAFYSESKNNLNLIKRSL